MPKKTRWDNDATAFENPFASLKKPGAESPISAAAQPPAVQPTTAPADEVALPKAKSARIERAHRAGKTVTVVSFHGNPAPEALKKWLKNAQNALGIGGSVEEQNVILQGDQTDRLKQAGLLR